MSIGSKYNKKVAILLTLLGHLCWYIATESPFAERRNYTLKDIIKGH